MELHGPIELQVRRIGIRYQYHLQANTKPQWLIAAISGHHPTTESRGVSDPPVALEVGVQYQYHQPANTKPQLFGLAIYGFPPILEYRGQHEAQERLGLGYGLSLIHI